MMRNRIIAVSLLTACIAGGVAAFAASQPSAPTAAVLRSTAIAQQQPADGRGGARRFMEPSVLSVQGEGRSFAIADQLEITLSVLTQEKTAEAALEKNSAQIEEVVAALKDADLTDDEISTGRFMVHPVMDYGQPQRGNGGAKAPAIVAYQVTNGVTIKTQKTDRVGEIIQAAVVAGVNQVDSLQFTLSNPQRARAEAIRRATQNARGEAEVLAEAAGVSLQRIWRINLDSAGSQQPPWPMMARGMEMAMDSGAPAPQIMPGQIEMIAAVTIEYHIDQRGDNNSRPRGEIEIEVSPTE